MKEFIEKLIESLQEWSFETEIVIPGSDGYDDTENREIICTKNAIEIVNELAEEYNNDFCEWHKGKGLYLHRTSCGEQDSYDDSYRYCPYCGKKIKIVELGKED